MYLLPAFLLMMFVSTLLTIMFSAHVLPFAATSALNAFLQPIVFTFTLFCTILYARVQPVPYIDMSVFEDTVDELRSLILLPFELNERMQEYDKEEDPDNDHESYTMLRRGPYNYLCEITRSHLGCSAKKVVSELRRNAPQADELTSADVLAVAMMVHVFTVYDRFVGNSEYWYPKAWIRLVNCASMYVAANCITSMAPSRLAFVSCLVRRFTYLHSATVQKAFMRLDEDGA